MNTGNGIKEGMVVSTSDGQRLGRVIGITSEGIQVEGGLFFPDGHRLLGSDIQEVRGDRIVLARDLAWLRKRGEATAKGYVKEAPATAQADEVVSVPLMEEQLEIRRRAIDQGEVAIHKKVETVTRTVDVPLRHEVIHVERVARADIKPDARYHAFEDQTFSVPLKGEEADVIKRAVYTGEVRLHKRAVEQTRHLSAQVRHEEIDLTGKGELESETAEELRRDSTSAETVHRAIKEPER
jgi:uncharacterized protein (TIGR02271 family)